MGPTCHIIVFYFLFFSFLFPTRDISGRLLPLPTTPKSSMSCTWLPMTPLCPQPYGHGHAPFSPPPFLPSHGIMPQVVRALDGVFSDLRLHSHRSHQPRRFHGHAAASCRSRRRVQRHAIALPWLRRGAVDADNTSMAMMVGKGGTVTVGPRY
jgi:hypothetical protein